VVTNLYLTSFTLTRNIAACLNVNGSEKEGTCGDTAGSGESCTLIIPRITKSNTEGQNNYMVVYGIKMPIR
jgi:hypothetical protein